MSNKNEYTEEELIKSLEIIKGYCLSRNKNCVDCMLSNANDECLIYEYPHLWSLKPRTVVRLLTDK